MVVRAHIKEQSRLSLGSYGRPRMTEALKELGLSMSRRRVDRLMRENSISMSGKGNCYDNTAVEALFKTIKAELTWRRSWPTRRAAELAIFECINGFYNPRRRHKTGTSLKWLRSGQNADRHPVGWGGRRLVASTDIPTARAGGARTKPFSHNSVRRSASKRSANPRSKIERKSFPHPDRLPSPERNINQKTGSTGISRDSVRSGFALIGQKLERRRNHSR